MATNTPLQGFFRKAKFQLQLPSRGRWYPKDSIALNENGTVDVFSMTATDDVKFRASEASVSGTSVYELVKSCVPNIKDPESIPAIDLDILLLAIRKASYGDILKLEVSVPKTSLKRTLELSIDELISDIPPITMWEENLTIVHEKTGEQLDVVIKPNSAKSLFGMTKALAHQNQSIYKVAENSEVADDDKLIALEGTVKELSELKIRLVIEGIVSVSTGTFKTDNSEEITHLIRNLDYDYFKTIEAHFNAQRKKFGIKPVHCISTSEEIAAGAPQSWTADVTFTQSDFYKTDE